MSQSSHITRDPYAGRDKPVRTYALVVGVVFLIAGVAGFVPGLTTNVDEMTFAGHMSESKLLGIFAVSVLHNLVHLAFGVLGIAMSRAPGSAVVFLIGGGVVYLALWIYGLVIDYDSDANFVPLNDADNWLHLVLGLGMIALGLLGRQQWRGTTSDTL
jgi:hypothetical protein